MTQHRWCEAIWTLADGPLERESVAAALFGAVGELVDVQPARYDLNRRDQWRRYGGRRLLVDLLTQRTQLVTIVEEDGIESGGVEVAIATGKHGESPQAIARWCQAWPPASETIERWIRAATAAFDDLALASFVLRVTESQRRDDSMRGRLAATDDRERFDEIRDRVDGQRRSFSSGAVKGWDSIGGCCDEARNEADG